MTESEPVVVTVMSSGATSATGGLVVTPVGQPNLMLKVVTPLTIIAVRALHAYVEGVASLVTIGLAAPKAMPTSDFLHLLGLSCSLAFAPVAVSILKNVAEVLGKFDQSHPTLTA